MPTGPAARVGDLVLHPLPPVLTPGPGSLNVLIGGKPAWRGVGGGAAGSLTSSKQASETRIKAAEAATLAAPTPESKAAAKVTEEALKVAEQAAMAATIAAAAAGGSDIHICATPLPIPPHGPGVVIDGSPTVLINGMPACRMMDTVMEAIGPPNKIAMGMPTVIIGDQGSAKMSPDDPALPDKPCRKRAAESGTPFIRA